MFMLKQLKRVNMSAKAIVRLLVEINVPDTWGDDCTIGQVKKQAKHSAIRTVSSIMENDKSLRLINEPEFVQIVHTKI